MYWSLRKDLKFLRRNAQRRLKISKDSWTTQKSRDFRQLEKLASSNWDKLGYSTHKFLLLVKPLLKIAPKCLWFRSCCLLVDFFANVSRFSIFTVLAISSEDLACFSLFVNFFSAEAWLRENKATKVRRWCEDIWKVRRFAIFAHEVMVGKIEKCVSPCYFCKERTWWITDSVKSSSWADFVPWNIKDPENKVTNGFSVTDVNKHGRILWFISE